MSGFTVFAALTVFIYAWASSASILTSAKELHYRQRRSSPKVAGGSLASITEFPFAVQLQLLRGDGPSRCGGSIIRPNIVLTAAHCVRRLPDTLSGLRNSTGGREYTLGVTVVAGESVLNGNGPHSQRREVIKIRRHPNYNNVTLENDLAVLLLSQPFEFDKTYVSQVALPLDAWQTFSSKAQLCGWGWLTADPDVPNKDLRKVDLRLVSNSVCDSYYSKFEGSVQLCAGGDGPGKACAGDSGGPLVCHAHHTHGNSRSQPYLCGVVSGGDGCKPTNGPGIYVRVPVFVPWIETQIQELTGQPPAPPRHEQPPSYSYDSPYPPPSSYSYEQPSYYAPAPAPQPYYNYVYNYPFGSQPETYSPSPSYYGGYGYGYGYGYQTPSYSYPYGPAPAYYFGYGSSPSSTYYSPPSYGVYSYN